MGAFKANVAAGHLRATLRMCWHALHGRRRRRPWAQITAAAATMSTARWFVAFLQDAFNFHRLVVRMRHQWDKSDDVLRQVAGHVPRVMRRYLRRRGLRLSPEEERHTIASRATSRMRELWVDIARRQHVLWFDNFFKPRTMANPSPGYASFNSTCLAVLPSRGVSHSVYQHPTYLQACHNAGPVARSIAAAYEELLAMVNTVRGEVLTTNNVRVPLDVMRGQASSLPWAPLMLTSCAVGTQRGLLKVLSTCKLVASHGPGAYTPVLVDENLHYRILRLAWSESCSPWDVLRYLRPLPFLYGIWHAYKYACSQIWRTFHPLLAVLWRGNVSSGHLFPSKPKLRSGEIIFAGLLMLPVDVLMRVFKHREQCQRLVDTVSNKHHRVSAAHITRHTPALRGTVNKKKFLLYSSSGVHRPQRHKLPQNSQL